jgi:hypothetical protein
MFVTSCSLVSYVFLPDFSVVIVTAYLVDSGVTGLVLESLVGGKLARVREGMLM